MCERAAVQWMESQKWIGSYAWGGGGVFSAQLSEQMMRFSPSSFCNVDLFCVSKLSCSRGACITKAQQHAWEDSWVPCRRTKPSLCHPYAWHFEVFVKGHFIYFIYFFTFVQKISKKSCGLFRCNLANLSHAAMIFLSRGVQSWSSKPRSWMFHLLPCSTHLIQWLNYLFMSCKRLLITHRF